ncbi:Butyryl-CoA dehydrogenase, partial [hydrothermal vent metagenome]
MNFEFTEEQLMIRQAARDYAQRELSQDVLEREEKAEFPARHLKNLAELGFLGMMVSPEYDGGGMDSISYVLAMEEIAKVDASMAVIMSVNNSL